MNRGSFFRLTRYIYERITEELGRAPAVVKVTLQVNGRTEFSGSRPAKTNAGIKMKCDIIDYVGGGTHMQKLGAVGLLGASPHMGDMYQFGVLQSTFFYVTVLLDKPTGETVELIFMRDMSKCVVQRELHSFGG